MARPSAQLDQKLLNVGRKHFAQYGATGLSVRKVAREAKVNLGMFNYYFENKDHFVRVILQEEYEKLFASLHAEFTSKVHTHHPRCRLQALLLTLAKFAEVNRVFLLSLFKDILSGNSLTLDFATINMPRHLVLILHTIQEGQTTGEITNNLSADQILIMCMSIVGPPILVGQAITHGLKKRIRGKKELSEKLLADSNIKKRISCLMKGLEP